MGHSDWLITVRIINEFEKADISTSLRSKRFRAVSEQRTRNDSQRPREKRALSFHFVRGQNRKSRSSSFLGLSLFPNHTEALAAQATDIQDLR